MELEQDFQAVIKVCEGRVRLEVRIDYKIVPLNDISSFTIKNACHFKFRLEILQRSIKIKRLPLPQPNKRKKKKSKNKR